MSFDILVKGTAEVSPENELKKKLAKGKPLRVKFGIDPTSPDIHLGHCVALKKLRQFQNLGHKVVLVIGEFTALIGDPSGRDSTRPMLTPADIKSNAEDYIKQASKIISTDNDLLEVVSNRKWHDEYTSVFDVMDMVGHFTAQQLWHRDSFKKRVEAGIGINMREFLYPVFQAYDSFAVQADIELGGTDQTFNLQRGRDLQIKMHQEPQVVITMPLLVGLDGKEKMSKSKNNHVGVNDNPVDMFGKLMSLPDNLIDTYMLLLTDNMRPNISHPMARKEAMADDIVGMLHGTIPAMEAHKEFTRVFSNKKLPSEIEIKSIGAGKHALVDIMIGVGFAPSKTQARKFIEAGAVKINGNKIKDVTLEFECNGDTILQVGKRKVCKLTE